MAIVWQVFISNVWLAEDPERLTIDNVWEVFYGKNYFEASVLQNIVVYKIDYSWQFKF